MSQVLTNEINKTITVKKKDITSFTPMLKLGILYISYDELDKNGVKVGEEITTTEGIDFQNVILNASQIAGTDIYQPLKQALYNELERLTGDSGTIE